MIILTGEFLNYEQNTNPNTGKLRSFINILEVERSTVRKVSVENLDPYLKLERGTEIELPVTVNAYKDTVYFQVAK